MCSSMASTEMADSTDTPNSGTNNEEKTDESETIKENEEGNDEKKTAVEEPNASGSEDKQQEYRLQLTESVNDPVCVLQMSGEQILAPETEDDGISIIPPSPGAYREPPYLIPSSPSEQIDKESNEKNGSPTGNAGKDGNISKFKRNSSPKDDSASEEPSVSKIAKPISPCCKITFSQDSTSETFEVAETQMSVDEDASARKRKHMEDPLTEADHSHSSAKPSIQQMISIARNHGKKIARIEAERANEPQQECTISKQIDTEETSAEKQSNGSPHSEGEICDIEASNEEKEWHLQLSCGTEPMECTFPEGSFEEKGSSDSPKQVTVAEEVIAEDDSRLTKDDTLPLFQIQKPTNIEQSSMTSDTKEDTTVFSHIQNLSSTSGDLTGESIGTPEFHGSPLSSTLLNPNLIKVTSNSSTCSDTAPDRSISNEMRDKNVEEIPLHSTQANGTCDSLSQLISHKVVKGRTHPIIYTDTLDEECIAYKDVQKSSTSSGRHIEVHFGNKDKKHPSNNRLANEGNLLKTKGNHVSSSSKRLDVGVQVNMELSKGISQKTCKKIVTTKRHITTQQVIIDEKVVKTTIVEEEDDPVIEYCEEDISPTLPRHRPSFSSGELADVSSSVASKSISSGSSPSLFAFPHSPAVRRSNTEEKGRIQKIIPTRLDASTDMETWSDSQHTDESSYPKKPKYKLKLNSEAAKTTSLCSSSPEIPISDVPESKQSHILSPGVQVMARWKDGCFYPGEVSAKDPDKNKWMIDYDDGGKASVSAKDLIVISQLEKGQRVLALSDDGCYDPGIIKDYYREGEEVGYVVERDYNETTRYSRSSIILSSEEALSLLKNKASTTTSSETEYCNITESRRRQSPRVNTSQRKKEKVKTFQDPLVNTSSSEQQNCDSDGTSHRRNARKKLKNGEANETVHSEITHSPKIKDSPSCKRKPHSAINEQFVDSPCTSKRSSYSETAIKIGEKEGPFRSPKVQKAERYKISKLAGTGEVEEKHNEKLFEDFAFLLSTGDRKSDDSEHKTTNHSSDQTEEAVTEVVDIPFDKNLIEKEIEARGGTVLDSIEGIQTMEGKQILLLSHDYLRTVKFMYCLASGIPCISHIWVKDCCSTNKILQYETYLLPAGFNIIRKKLVEWHGRKEVLKGLQILVSSSNKNFVDMWSPILIAAEAKLVHRIPPQRKSTDVLCTIDAVITDLSCPQNVIRRATQMKIPILSVEWVIQCLIAGERLPVDSHPKFNYGYVP